MNLNSISTNLNRLYGLVSDDPFRLQSSVGQSVGSRTGLGIPSTSVKLSDYGRLQSSLSELRRASANLDARDEIAAYKVSSSTNVVQASAGKQVQGGQTLGVEVNQLARAQKLQSQAVADADTTQIGGGTLRIEFGRLDESGNGFNPTSGSARSLTIQSTDSSLDRIASRINRADIGVTAKVAKDSNDQYRLEITGKQSGAAQAFRITVDDTDGNDTDSTQGLSRLAFDPDTGPGYGKNLSTVQIAQDAEATVDGKRLSSNTNTFSNVVPGINLTANTTGTARITITRDTGQGEKSAKALVAAFNTFQGQLKDLGSDGLTRKIGNDIDRAISGAETGAGQKRLTLSDLGIRKDGDGQLKLDEDKFKQAFASDPEGATALLGNAAARLGAASEDAQSGVLRKTSTSLRLNDAAPRGLSDGFNPASNPLAYRQTTSNLYGLAQYLSIAGLR
ncbi:flagellar filament capping protein FliD [Chitinimonas sp. BJYL2]|uniref:flagellar filament capping protein FliD n=1 Tax=Chitinimonas sp. BJYL2 TaxID=2976696 RepID=UPI0022B3D467|nr:flagellar filament capping protein FliD [Chitinimonas sp. BJYL2]